MEIVREVVDRQFQPKLLEWALTSTLGENSKKGLVVIKKVVDIRGMKRFRNYNANFNT